MATLNSTVLTLLDHAKRLDPDGKIASIAELLSQSNEVLKDCLYKEGNLPTGMRSTLRTQLPAVGWRRVNEGTIPSKSRTGQTEDACAMLEAWGSVDRKAADLNGNTAAFRLSEAMAFIEGMAQEMARVMFYGNSGTTPEQFDGFSTRYSSLTGTNSQNIVPGGGAGADNSSIWLICWGENVHGIFPKGSKAGLDHIDHGLQIIENAGGVTGALMTGYRDQYTWEGGLHVRDWRYAVRGCNIDVSNLVAESSNVDIQKLLTKMSYRIPNMAGVRPAIYMNRTCIEFFDIQRQKNVKDGGQLGYNDVDGKWVPAWRGIPIRLVDQLTEAEALVA